MSDANAHPGEGFIAEEKRLPVLRAFFISDAPLEIEFDRLVKLAAQLCRTPIAALSLVDEKRQWFKAVEGLSVRQTDISLSFCKHAIQHPDYFEAHDARLDLRFVDDALVTGPPHIRFYGAYLLIAPGGQALGTLMVIDRIPRHLRPRQREQLRKLKPQAMIALELRRHETLLQKALDTQMQAHSALHNVASEIVRIIGLDPAHAAFRDAEHAVLVATDQLPQRATLLDQAKDAIFVKDLEQRITFWNGGAERLFGFSREEAMGRYAVELLKILADDERAMIESLEARDEYSDKQLQRYKDGHRVLVHGHLTRVRDEGSGESKAILAIWTDITQLRHDQEKVQYLAFHDPLTPLPDRAALMDRLSHALAASSRPGHYAAMIFLDLDNFKTLNDTLRHDMGDLLLQQVAARLRACVRSFDVVARLGGNEFVVLLEELGVDARRGTIRTETATRKIVDALAEPYDLRDRSYDCSASLGITLFNGVAPGIDALLKQAGRNTMRFFEPRMQQLLQQRASLEADLRRASLRQEFELYYQPQLEREGQLRGMEALLRWHHPQRGLVLPDEFRPPRRRSSCSWASGYCRPHAGSWKNGMRWGSGRYGYR